MKFGVLGTQRTVHSSEVSILWTEIGILRSLVSILGTNPGGGTWVFFGWVCAARDSKLAPRSKKISPKIDTPF